MESIPSLLWNITREKEKEEKNRTNPEKRRSARTMEDAEKRTCTEDKTRREKEREEGRSLAKHASAQFAHSFQIMI